MPVAERSERPTHALHLIVQLDTGGDGIYRFGKLITASVELRHPPHHGCMPHLGSAVVSDHVGRNAKQPRKSVVVACVVAVSCLEGRLEHIGEQVFGGGAVHTARQVAKDRRGVPLDDQGEALWISDRLADYRSVRAGPAGSLGVAHEGDIARWAAKVPRVGLNRSGARKLGLGPPTRTGSLRGAEEWSVIPSTAGFTRIEGNIVACVGRLAPPDRRRDS